MHLSEKKKKELRLEHSILRFCDTERRTKSEITRRTQQYPTPMRSAVMRRLVDKGLVLKEVQSKLGSGRPATYYVTADDGAGRIEEIEEIFNG